MSNINSFNDYSTTPANNTNLAGTSIAINCPPADVGYFMRGVLAQIAYNVQGSGGPSANNWYCGALTTVTTYGGTGNATLAGALTVSDAASEGSIFEGNLTVANSLSVANDSTFNGSGIALSVPSGTFQASFIQTTGSQTSSQSGWYFFNGGSGAFGPTVVSYGVVVASSNVLANGYFAVSDERVKSDIRPITLWDAETFVMKALPVRYMKHGVMEAGLIAQDQVRAGYGEFVGSASNPKLEKKVDGDGFVSAEGVELTLNYNNYVAYLIAALQSALTRIAALEEKLA